MRYGLDTHGVKRIIQEKINKNPDIYYFINNDYIEELINFVEASLKRPKADGVA